METENTSDPGTNRFHDISANNIVARDISANDISANDISANNIYVNSIKIKETGENLSLSDLSGVDSSLFSNINNNDILMFAGVNGLKAHLQQPQ